MFSLRSFSGLTVGNLFLTCFISVFKILFSLLHASPSDNTKVSVANNRLQPFHPSFSLSDDLKIASNSSLSNIKKFRAAISKQQPEILAHCTLIHDSLCCDPFLSS
jgi:hypothetical protein